MTLMLCEHHVAGEPDVDNTGLCHECYWIRLGPWTAAELASVSYLGRRGGGRASDTAQPDGLDDDKKAAPPRLYFFEQST